MDPYDVIEVRSWDQIALLAECIGMARMEPISEILRAVVGTMGGNVESTDPRYGSRSSRAKAPAPRPGKNATLGKRTGRPTAIDFSDPKSVARARARDARIALLASGVDGLAMRW